MVLVVKCLICGQLLNYTLRDHCKLAKHIESDHPNMEKVSKTNSAEKVLSKKTEKFDIDEQAEEVNEKNQQLIESAGTSKHVRYASDENVTKQISYEDDKAKVLFVRTSSSALETGRNLQIATTRGIQTGEKIFCPRCFSFECPIVKAQTPPEPTFVSTVLMTCLSLCSQTFPNQQESNVQCSVCGNLLGVFDPEKQLIFTKVAPQPKT